MKFFFMGDKDLYVVKKHGVENVVPVTKVVEHLA